MKNKVNKLSIILLAVPSFVLCGCTSKSIDEMYNDSVVDAMLATPDEIKTLVTLTPEDNKVNYVDGKYEMITLHQYPDSYPDDTDVVLEHGLIWVSSAKEFEDFVKANKNESDWGLRLHQLNGVPTSSVKTHLTTFYISSDVMTRPAFVTDPTKQIISTDYNDMNESEDYMTWFDNQILDSYYRSSYPWTRLGYTFDWKDNGNDYGLSEFLVEENSTVHVEKTLPYMDYINYILNS